MARLLLRGKTWYSDYRASGKRIQRALSPDRREAQRLLDEMILVRRSEKYGVVPESVSWSFFKERYFEYSRGSKAPQTVYRDDLAFRMLERVFPVQRLDQVTPELLERLKLKLKEDGFGEAGINRSLRAIKAAMRKAEGWKYRKPEDWKSVKLFKDSKGRLLYFSMDELRTLLENTSGPWKTVVMLGARAGLRRGEIYHLEWTDIDFERGRIHISPKADWSPKDYERRWVPMSPDLKEYLKSIKGSGWVLGKDRPTLGSLTVYFRELVEKLNLTGSIHTLRHTFAAHLASNGAPLEKIGKLLGHSNLRVTQAYSHLSPESVMETINFLHPLCIQGLHPPCIRGQRRIGPLEDGKRRRIIDGKPS